MPATTRRRQLADARAAAERCTGVSISPVASLPQVDYPTIMVTAELPGAEPQTMATAVAAPLERRIGQIAGITELTSTSLLGITTVVAQFELNRPINAAARDVQAAINAAAPGSSGGYVAPTNLAQE